MLGETFPVKNCMAMLRLEMRKVDRVLRGKSNAQIMRMEMIKDEEKLAALQILNLIFLNALIVKPKFAPFVQLKSVEITLKYGLSALASNAFAL
jgi:predicted ATPase